tara:strand:- start:17 stop:199 length:183 start_codon:yes stop_codon:yes gene_type:complete
MIVIGVFVYFLLGVIWCYIDVEHFETRIDNPLAAMIALLIWPLALGIRTLQSIVKFIWKC